MKITLICLTMTMLLSAGTHVLAAAEEAGAGPGPETSKAPAAAEPPAPAVAEGEAPATNETGLVALRDPFWPVGYEKPKPKVKVKKEPEKVITQKEIEKKYTIKWPKLKVGGYSKSGNIDNALVKTHKGSVFVETGDTITTESGGLVYCWKVTSVAQNNLALERLYIHPKGEPNKRIPFKSE